LRTEIDRRAAPQGANAEWKVASPSPEKATRPLNAGKEFVMIEKLKDCKEEKRPCALCRLNCDRAGMDEGKIVLDREWLLHLGLCHQKRVEQGEVILRKLKEENANPEVIKGYELETVKAKGFKENVEEIFWHIDGKFESLEEIAKEFGDVSGLW